MHYLYLLTFFVKVGYRSVNVSIYLTKSVLLPKSELKHMLGRFSYTFDLAHSNKSIMESEDIYWKPCNYIVMIIIIITLKHSMPFGWHHMTVLLFLFFLVSDLATTSCPEIPFSAETLGKYYSVGFPRMRKDPVNPGTKQVEALLRKTKRNNPPENPTCLAEKIPGICVIFQQSPAS